MCSFASAPFLAHVGGLTLPEYFIENCGCFWQRLFYAWFRGPLIDHLTIWSMSHLTGFVCTSTLEIESALTAQPYIFSVNPKPYNYHPFEATPLSRSYQELEMQT